MPASIIFKWEPYNRSNIEFCISLRFFYFLNDHFCNFIIYIQIKIKEAGIVPWKSPGILFRNLIDVWRGKRKNNARTDNLNGNNKTVGDDKEEKELGDELEDSFKSTFDELRFEPNNKSSSNDNKKDKTVRWLAKLVQLMAENSLAIDETLLSTKHASFHNFEVSLL